MKSVQITSFGSPDVLEIAEVDPPEPGPGQVAIEVSYAGVNFADVMTRRGDYHRAGLPPIVPGLEVAGTVTAIGEGVVLPAVGTRVAAFTGTGGYAEVAVADATLTYVLSAGIGDEVAAALPTILPTAVLLVEDVARVRPDESVLVHAAAGGVGSVLGQVARTRGADPVIGTVGSPDKLAYAASRGYDGVLLRDGFVDGVRAATGGRGVDVVFDSIGGAVRAESVDALAPMGRLVAFGNASGEPEVAPDAGSMRSGNRGYLGFSMGSLSGVEPLSVRAAARRGIRMVESGEVRVHVTEVIPLGEAARAHRLLEERRTRGKLLLAVE